MPDPTKLIGQNVTLAFRTTHIDRAGKTSSTRIANAEIVQLDPSGAVLLVAGDGIHLQFPSEQLVAAPDRAGYIGGQEIVRDFHNGVEPFSLRWLNGRELKNELSTAQRAGQ